MAIEAGIRVRVHATAASNQTVLSLDGKAGEAVEVQVWSPVTTAVLVRFDGDVREWIYADNLEQE